MNKRAARRLVLMGLVVMITVSGCGRVKEAAQLARSVADENYDLKETDVRRFYEAVGVLEKQHPDIDFEVAMTAALGAISQGVDLEEVVEKETDLSFDEYSGLSTALIMVQSDAAGVALTEEMVSSMEEGLSQFDDADVSELTGEQQAAIDQQRQAFEEAKAEMEAPEFQARKQKVEMVMAIRKEMGF